MAIRRTVLAGVLALGAMLGSGAASAAPVDLGAVTAQGTPFAVAAGGAVLSFSTSADPDGFYLLPNNGQFDSLGALTLATLGGPVLTIGFSVPVPSVSFRFATFEAGATVTLSAFLGGTAVGSTSAVGTPGSFFAEGALQLAGRFDRVTVQDVAGGAFAIGAIEVPEPGTLGLLGMGVFALGLMRRRAGITVLAGLLAGFAAPATAQLTLRNKVSTTQEIVVTANPLATEAGARVLREGGNAMDAAIAVQAMLGLVEPQSTGIGGGGFVVYYDAQTRTVTTFDGREAAPAAANGFYFYNQAGTPLGFSEAQFSGRSVGVPGIVKLWEATHRRFGSRPLASSLRPAIETATAGFAISPRMAAAIDGSKASLAVDAEARAYFLNTDGTGKAAGTLLQNPAYASVLGRIAFGGVRAFYTGPVAAAIVAAVTGDSRPGGPGSMTLQDLANYRVVERVPVCGPFRGFVVCGMGPPSSGGIGVLQILGILEARGALPPPNTADPLAVDLQTVHQFLQANRLAFADRAVYLADPAFVTVPTAGLIDPAYIAGRAALVTTGALAPGLATAGTPPAVGASGTPDASPPRFGGTSHVSIVDRFGNAASMTTTVESGFGNQRLVQGFLLNNELTDFSFDPGPVGAPVANRVEGGKRPRSSMAPTIVFTAAGQPAFLAGSPGGASIIGTTAQSLLAMIAYGLDPQQAANQAHFQNNNTEGTTLETLFSATVPPGQPGGAPAASTGLIGPFDVRSLRDQLIGLGYTVTTATAVLTSGLSLVRVVPGGFEGGADPRREGTVAGR